MFDFYVKQARPRRVACGRVRSPRLRKALREPHRHPVTPDPGHDGHPRRQQQSTRRGPCRKRPRERAPHGEAGDLHAGARREDLAAQTVRGLAAADGEQGRQPRALARADRQRGPDERGRPAPRRQCQSGGLPQPTQADHRVRRHHQAGKQTVGRQPRPAAHDSSAAPPSARSPSRGNARREHPLGRVAPGLLLPGAHRPALGPPGGTCASPTGDNVHVTRGSGPPRRYCARRCSTRERVAAHRRARAKRAAP
ncbi:CGNR zinc finger domain-containing protein [Streptomyces griseoluteus]|uniref:CGNR zinc finger domain-containing protein n=1 Tax=Streptomyces griseoluteus TaxID=29306 RepID=UPI003F4DB728